MRIKVVISKETAVRNGRANAGEHWLDLTDEFVASLEADVREELLVCLSDRGTASPVTSYYCVPEFDARIVDATLPALAKHLQERVDYRKAVLEGREAAKQAEEKERAAREKENEAKLVTETREWFEKPFEEKVYESRGRLSLKHFSPAKELAEEAQAHFVELEARVAARNALYDKAEKAVKEQRKALTSVWVAEHCDAETQARHAEGFLPEAEILDRVRKHVFAPFDKFERYARLTSADARHDRDSEGCNHCEARVGFSTHEADELTAAEYARLTEIRKVLAANFSEARCVVANPAELRVPLLSRKVEPREHRAECKGSSCPGPTMRRSARVEIEWNGHSLVREYALTAPGEDSHV